MAEHVYDRVRRLLREEPSTRIHFTDAITAGSYYNGTRPEGSVLFLHPSHRPLVDELLGRRDGDP